MPDPHSNEVAGGAERRAAPPRAARTSRARAKAKPRLTHAQRLAMAWDERGEDARDEILELVHEAMAEGLGVQEMADDAADMLRSDPGELMDFLRARAHSEVHSGDGYRVFSDLFAVPLRGRPEAVQAFVGSPLLQERLAMLLRGSGMVGGMAETIVLPIALPAPSAANLNLDGVLMVRAFLEDSLQGDPFPVDVVSILRQASERAGGEAAPRDAVLLGLRVYRVADGEEDPHDYFRASPMTDREGEAYLRSWAERAGILSAGLDTREAVFIGTPTGIDGAASFLAYSRTSDDLEAAMLGAGISPRSPDDARVLHAMPSGNGLLLSVTEGGRTAGPVFVSAALLMDDEEGFLGLFEDDFSAIRRVEDIRSMPGAFAPRGTLRN